MVEMTGAAFVGGSAANVWGCGGIAARICRVKTRHDQRTQHALRMTTTAQKSQNETPRVVPDASEKLELSRREVLHQAVTTTFSGALAAALVISSDVEPAVAVLPPSGLGGLVEMYKDIPKGFSIFRPSGWNQFDTLPGEYDVKWQDVINPIEMITVLTTPVSKGKTTADLGNVEDVGKKLAESRGGSLISASSKTVENVEIYVIELASERKHQYLALSVAKSKLYSATANCPANRWNKREKLLRGCIDSFIPKL